MPIGDLPRYEDYVPRTYSQESLTKDEFVHPSDLEYPDTLNLEGDMKKKCYEVFHDGIIESLEDEKQYDDTIGRLEKEGYEIKQTAAVGTKSLLRTLMSKDKDYLLR